MKTRLTTKLTALTLTAFAGASAFANTAFADESEVEMAWQQPGYVTETVIVTAPRPEVELVIPDATDLTGNAASDSVTLAYQEPGYVQEVVVVTAKRVDPIEQYRAMARKAAIERGRIRATRFLSGAPVR